MRVHTKIVIDIDGNILEDEYNNKREWIKRDRI